MAESFDKPDVRQLGERDLPGSAFPAARRQDFRVHFAAEAHAQIARHAAEDVSVEIGGVLVGKWQRDADGPFVEVSESIRSDLAASKSGEVTFTHDAWAEINKEMDSRFPQLHIVGWYHSHPDFGVFLSQRDTFIHEHFFTGPGQIAYVVDPVRKTDGVYAWRNGKLHLCPYYWVGDQICVAPSGERRETSRPAKRARSEPPPDPDATEDMGPLLSTLGRAALYVAVFLIGYLLASFPSSWEHRRMVEGTVAHYGIWKGLRPGLKENLDAAGSDLKKIAMAVGALANEHVQVAGEDGASKKSQWDQVQNELRRTQRLLDLIEAAYCLDEEESAAVAKLIAAKIATLSGQPPTAGDTAAGDASKEKEFDKLARPSGPEPQGATPKTQETRSDRSETRNSQGRQPENPQSNSNQREEESVRGAAGPD